MKYLPKFHRLCAAWYYNTRACYSEWEVVWHCYFIHTALIGHPPPTVHIYTLFTYKLLVTDTRNGTFHVLKMVYTRMYMYYSI